MAKGFTIEFKGLKETIAKLEDKGDDIKKQVDFAIGVNTDAMATEAKQRAPVDTGRLRSSISSNKVKDYLYELVAQVDYAPYLEFGTGPYAATYVKSIEPEWEKLAAQFIKTGNGTIKERPYLYPAYKRILPILYKDLEQITNENERL
jgi:HK97 gp10 family phage protein